MHPLGINNQVSCFSGRSWSFVECSGEEKCRRVLAQGVFECLDVQNSASGHSNIAFCSRGEGAPDTLRPYDMASACLLVLCRGEGAPETLMGASNHSSISFFTWVSE